MTNPASSMENSINFFFHFETVPYYLIFLFASKIIIPWPANTNLPATSVVLMFPYFPFAQIFGNLNFDCQAQ